MPMPPATAQPAFEVTYPFDGSNGIQADMILRSADGVDFRVMKGVLAVSSPIFQDMTALASPLAMKDQRTSAEVSDEGLPIVVMYESNADVLDALLRILYPVVSPKLDDLELISGLLRAAQKYDMLAVLQVVKDALHEAATENLSEHAMEVYLIAYEFGLDKIKHIAIDRFLRCPFQPTYFPGLEKASASALYHLYDYRRRVADAVDMLFTPIESCDLPSELRYIIRELECLTKNTKPSEGCGSSEAGYNISGWWSALRVWARNEVQKAPLSDDVVNLSLIAKAACSSNCCSSCKDRVFRQLTSLELIIKLGIRRLAAKVKFELPQ